MNQNDKKQSGSFPPMKRANKSLHEQGEDIDLDLTPMMNLLMVLIFFLMSMAVFTQIAVIDFSLPPAQAQGTGNDNAPKELDISIVVTQSGFQIVGTGKKLDMIPKAREKYQFDKLRLLLKAIKFQYPSQNSVVLVFDSSILYEDIIKFMDICRESQFPDIGLSGDVG
jgi:biopolymer transport protein ExbD